FRPGLVGGHCIGVDPYYLTHKAQEVGHTPEVILAGRRINDQMGQYVVSQVVKLMLKRRIHVEDSNILIMGLTFKENCPDIRNTRVTDIVKEFREYGANIDIYDPWADRTEANKEYGLELVTEPAAGKYDAITIAVSHQQFRERGMLWIRSLGRRGAIIYDIKSMFNTQDTEGRL
ncbi:MAG: UDP binding domain-containing protein, partial [Planctomycetota bacterium]